MKFRFALAVAILLAMQALTMATVSWAAQRQPVIEAFDFANTLKPWVAGANHTECLSKVTLQLQEDITVGPLPANSYAALTNECGGTVWMVARLSLQGNSFTVSFDARDVSGCVGCIPLLYVGRSLPYNASQFSTDYESLDPSWKAHKLQAYIGGPDMGGTQSVYVALGFVNLDLERPDGKQLVGFDNIQINAEIEQPICLECDRNDK